MIKIGIVGLPNVGKSTFFSTITKLPVLIANYPFATINPNVGVIEIDNLRLKNLAKIYNSERIVFSKISFVDIAGLVKGASKGEGLGNKFLNNIRDVDIILHVVRLFEDTNIIHVENNIDPKRDIEILNLELILSDLAQLEKWIQNNEKKITMSKNKDQQQELNCLEKAILLLKKSLMLNQEFFSIDEMKILHKFNLLTIKPMIYLGNISEDMISNNNHQQPSTINFKKFLEEMKSDFFLSPVYLEKELGNLTQQDAKTFYDDLNIESVLSKVSILAIKKLSYEEFFTVGKKEAHSWLYKSGSLAPQVAGIIHSDFEKGFIKVEVFNYDDLIKEGDEKKLREKGLVRLEGKDYLIKDGDICTFRFNV